MTRRLSPAVARRTRPAQKKSQTGAAFSQLPSSAVILLWSGHAWSAIEHHLAVARGWWSAIERHLLVAIYDNVL